MTIKCLSNPILSTPVLALFAISTVSGVMAAQPHWANPEVYAVNREPAHAFSLVFPDADSARPEPNWENPFAGSSRYLMLNGDWKFYWSENPSQAPAEFFTVDYNASGWDTIPVPLPWQIAGYGQLYYYNGALPMLLDPRNQRSEANSSGDGESTMDLLNPKTPEREQRKEAAARAYVPPQWNPVGCYLTEFEMPEKWAGQRVVLHFSGVKSAFTCWVNGKEVGYSQDSFTPAEFDITTYLKSGKNRLAVQVIRWSDGTYMENQDRIRQSGIFRDVYLFATPKAHISDFFVKADVAKSLDAATLSVDVDLRNTGKDVAKDGNLEIELIDPKGVTVLTKSVKVSSIVAGKTIAGNLSASVHNPALWHCEDPNLYTLLIKLQADSKDVEVIRQDVGFRRFEHDALGNYYLNGKRYYMRGVNRSDCSPETGYYVSYQDMLEDAMLMRQLNINNVRTSHNPNDPRWYAICNRFGITILDEANLESHGIEHIYSDLELEGRWRPQAVFRMVNMVERDKNQPCVILWSLGNEQFDRVPDQPVVRAMYDAAKAIDPSRGIFCERMFDDKQDASFEPYLDAIGPMYRGKELYVKWHEENRDRRPFFMSEYAHAMGNSMSNLAELWNYFEQHDGLNGGQIWDWRDQSVLWPLPGLPGKHFTYGGDWNEPTGNNSVFCMNGVVLPDHKFTGKSYEVKGVYQQVAVSAGDAPGRFKVKNKYALSNLSEYDVSWELLRDGIAVENGKLKLDLEPLTEGEFNLPVNVSSFNAACDYHFNVDVKLKKDMPWAKAGFVVAREQIELQKGRGTSEMVALQGQVKMKQSPDGNLYVKAGESVIGFDMKQGLLVKFSHQDHELLAPDSDLAGLEANFNFHPTDDFFVWPSPPLREGFKRDLNTLKKIPVSAKVLKESTDAVSIEIVNDYLNEKKEGYRHFATYTVLPSGIVQVDNQVQKIELAPNDLCLRIGVRLPVAKRFDHSSYLAYGPHENYLPRRAWDRYGIHTHPAGDFFEHYVRPQECGNRTDLKWIALQDDQGVGLQIVSEKVGNGSIMPWSVEKFRKAKHVPELGESTRWIMRYDAEFAGIAKSDNIRFDGDYVFSYSIRPLSKGSNPAEVALPQVPDAAKRPYEKTGKAISSASTIPADWKWVSEKATVTYSSRSKFAPPRDTLLSSQEGAMSFHTEEEKEPWLIVDLKKAHPVAGIEILNRADAQGNRTANLRVWLSTDGESWQQVFKTGRPEERWLVSLDQPQTARFVKIGLVNPKPQFFHLKGVKVFSN